MLCFGDKEMSFCSLMLLMEKQNNGLSILNQQCPSGVFRVADSTKIISKGFYGHVFLGLPILIWSIRFHNKKALLWVWSVKCLVMLVLMLFYEYYYQIDSFGYFSKARHGISERKAIDLGVPSLPVVFITWLHHYSFWDQSIKPDHDIRVWFDGLIPCSLECGHLFMDLSDLTQVR